METSKIEIFESISLLSILIPYNYSSHEGFLFLSKLSKSIREYLLEHYPEYRRFMHKYSKKIGYMEDKHLEMKLPLDLFKFSVLYVDSEKAAEFLVSLIHTLFNLNYLSRWALSILYCNLTYKVGLYFGEYYMSDQIWFEKIYVWPECIGKLNKVLYWVQNLI